jgi:hypothetical protein
MGPIGATSFLLPSAFIKAIASYMSQITHDEAGRLRRFGGCFECLDVDIEYHLHLV